MPDRTDLAIRMKMYEHMGFHQARLMPGLPALARLDGRAFHTLTKGLERPFDIRLSNLMVDLTKKLVDETNAIIGYTQSDEITLLWYPKATSEMMFDGKTYKMKSIFAAIASVFFSKEFNKRAIKPGDTDAYFDCRVWNVPNKAEAVNTFVWREMDATRNSISMAAQSVFSHNELHGQGSSDMQEMLHSKGINWNDYPDFFKRGTYVRRVVTSKPFTAEEIELLPPKHNARKNPELIIERSVVSVLSMPPIRKVANRVEVIFDGADPQI
jgi:tRNA(His) guanylyltransferase